MSRVRIATWNLNRVRPRRGRRATALLSHMSAIAPDVWVLTETFSSFEPGPEYTLVTSSAKAPDREAAAGECWVAIWARVKALPVMLKADPERTAAARVQLPNELPLVIVGTVLPWLADSRYAPLKGGAAFCEVLKRQAAEWCTLEREHPDAALCVGGDFNQDLASSHYYGSAKGRASLERALADTRLVCLTGGAHDPLASVPNQASIDHLCVSERLLRKAQPDVGTWPAPPLARRRLTDHYGVYVDLKLTERAPSDRGPELQPNRA